MRSEYWREFVAYFVGLGAIVMFVTLFAYAG